MKHEHDSEKCEDGLTTFMEAYSWQQAMMYAKFKFSDIKKIIFSKEGFNDGDHWQLVVQLKNRKYGWLNAWCDYSGWDCQSGGNSDIVNNKKEALQKVAGD